MEWVEGNTKYDFYFEIPPCCPVAKPILLDLLLPKPQAESIQIKVKKILKLVTKGGNSIIFKIWGQHSGKQRVY